VGACSPPPPSYQLVSLAEARRLLGERSVALVDAVAAGATVDPSSGVLWEIDAGGPVVPPQLDPARPVLIVASSEPVAHRSAAALARAGARGVTVCIARSAEERSSLYAHAPGAEEVQRGRDS
jgi:hypothetical protein